MAAVTASVYASEYEIIRLNADGARTGALSAFVSGGDGAKGSLYGLWTHSYNVLVQLANPALDQKEASWKTFCKEQKLERVGLWGTQEPRIADRPTSLEAPLGFIYIRCSSGGSPPLVCYSLPASGAGSYAYRRSSAQRIEMTVLPASSPYRSMKDPEGTRRIMASAQQSGLPSQKHTPSLAGHWVERPEYADFLRNLRERFRREDIEVKQYQPPGSDIIAFQIKQESTGFSSAVAFPSDFDRKRQVQVYGRQGGAPGVITLPETIDGAFGALLNSFTEDKTEARSSKKRT